MHANKALRAITYNHLNLSQTTRANGQTITYTYDATGRKLKKVYNSTTTDYIGTIHYQNGIITFILTQKGRALKTGACTIYHYEYLLKDHLGNTRMMITSNSAGELVLEDIDYCPFGCRIDLSRDFKNRMTNRRQKIVIDRAGNTISPLLPRYSDDPRDKK